MLGDVVGLWTVQWFSQKLVALMNAAGVMPSIFRHAVLHLRNGPAASWRAFRSLIIFSLVVVCKVLSCSFAEFIRCINYVCSVTLQIFAIDKYNIRVSSIFIQVVSPASPFVRASVLVVYTRLIFDFVDRQEVIAIIVTFVVIQRHDLYTSMFAVGLVDPCSNVPNASSSIDREF